MKTKSFFLTLLLAAMIFVPAHLSAQVTIGSDRAPSPWALLDLDNSERVRNNEQPKALHLPRLTDDDRDDLNLEATAGPESPARGLMIFNIDSECLEFWSGTAWISLCEGDEPPFITPPHWNEACRTDTACLALRRFNSTVRRLADVTNPVSNWVENPDQNAVTFTLPVAVATGINFNMMPVTGGVFYMGEQNINPAHPNHGTLNVTPVHQVGVSSFYMSQTLVTAELFAAVMGANGTFHGQLLTPVTGGGTQSGTANANIPRNTVNWYDAVVFANRLSVILGRDTVYSHDSLDLLNPPSIPTANNANWNAIRQNLSVNGFRLPTEAEWEYAARGGQRNEHTRTLGADGTSQYRFLFSGSNTSTDVAWYMGHSGLNENQPVRGLAPNQLGLFDMSGLAWEWVWDWWLSPYTSCCTENPVGPASGSTRVTRGGSRIDNAGFLRVSNRAGSPQGSQMFHVGIRLAFSAVE